MLIVGGIQAALVLCSQSIGGLRRTDAYTYAYAYADYCLLCKYYMHEGLIRGGAGSIGPSLLRMNINIGLL